MSDVCDICKHGRIVNGKCDNCGRPVRQGQPTRADIRAIQDYYRRVAQQKVTSFTE